MWQYRELIRNLTVADLKNRYQNTALGFFWSLLSPLLLALVLYFIFSHLFGREENFAINLLVGIMAWRFFANGTSSSLGAIVGKPSLVTKVYIPRQILVLSNTLANIISSLLEFIVLLPIIFVLLGITAPLRRGDMMSAIIVDNVSKKFRIPHEKKTTVFQNIVGLIKRQFDYEEFWALKDVSFEVKKGEALGIIGRNGSGKSTLLKILANVLYPNSGSVSLNGKVASFLELGVGFQPELTAKENVYIYSSILGLRRKHVDRIYDDIFDFAELKKFETMKLKNFSSGMYLRLAFSTAVHATPDTFLIDEVFAVGDESFKKKCQDKMNRFKTEGKTIVFVSHALDAVKALCQQSMLLNEGRIVTMGDTEKVINDYLAMLQKAPTR